MAAHPEETASEEESSNQTRRKKALSASTISVSKSYLD